MVKHQREDYEDVGGRCGSCRWWDAAKAGQGVHSATQSACRHRSPTLGKVLRGFFPVTSLTEWCGDWAELPDIGGADSLGYQAAGRYRGYDIVVDEEREDG